jgi:hypothetical protein
MDDNATFAPVVRKPKVVLEKVIERRHVERVKRAGGLSLKFSSVGRSSVPDRIDMFGVDAMMAEAASRGVVLDRATAIALLGAAIRFSECKRPGGKPTPAQAREHDLYRSMGFTVNVVDA